jgi:hypothetical protein
MILAVWRGLGATAPLVAEMAVTVQPSRSAISYKGASWFDWPRSLVPTRTYIAARLVALPRPTIPITGIQPRRSSCSWISPISGNRSKDQRDNDGQSHQTNNSQVRRRL